MIDGRVYQERINSDERHRIDLTHRHLLHTSSNNNNNNALWIGLDTKFRLLLEVPASSQDRKQTGDKTKGWFLVLRHKRSKLAGVYYCTYCLVALVEWYLAIAGKKEEVGSKDFHRPYEIVHPK